MRYNISWRKFVGKGKCFEDQPDKVVTLRELRAMLKNKKVLVKEARLIYEIPGIETFTMS